MALTVGSLFAGIGGFDLGFERAGFSVRWQAEQDAKAQSVLQLRFPQSVLYEDVRLIQAGFEPVDVICGGFPCQDVSVAGKREGLKGERTGLFWEVVRIADALKPRWMVLENVPGLLSSHGGRDFHTVLAALAERGFRRAYRILDSRYFGVAQRRRRVFLVLRARSLGDGPEAVLFESTGGERDSQTGAETRQDVAATLRGRSHGAGINPPGRGGEDDQNLVAFNWQTGQDQEQYSSSQSPTLNVGQTPAVYGVHANERGELRTSPLAGSLNGSRSGKQFEGVFATLNSGGNEGGFRTEPGEHLIVPERARALVGSMWKGHDDDTDTLIPTLTANMGHHGYGSDRGDGSSVVATIGAATGGQHLERHYEHKNGVRRLTPLECERLQGFPDGWTCLCGKGHLGSSFCECADSPRYRQLGNAVTVPVAQWIAERIKEAEGVAG